MTNWTEGCWYALIWGVVVAIVATSLIYSASDYSNRYYDVLTKHGYCEVSVPGINGRALQKCP